MRISTKAEYAIRALIEIADQDQGLPVTADAVATAQQISRSFLLTIFADLRRAGLLHSQRGQSGGWLLARPADMITLAHVIRAVDGPLASIHGRRPETVDYDTTRAPLQLVWIAMRSSLREVLEAVSVQHLVDGDLPQEVTARISSKDAWLPH